MYKIYPSVLDAFQYYLDSENDEAFQDLIDKINRKPFSSEAAEKGTAFNEIVDKVSAGLIIDDDTVSYGGFKFKSDIVKEFAAKFESALPQVFVQGVLQTAKGQVLLYGYMDEIIADRAHDIKTTGNYTFPKYNNNWQHRVYLFCLKAMGIDVSVFEYNITDFTNIFCEEYSFKAERDTVKLANFCEHFISFLERNKGLITDKKIFGED